MEKVTKKNLHYELMYIIANKYTEDEAKEIAKKIEKMLKEKKAKITFVDNWGKRRLAYEINHYRHGYYLVVELDVDPENIILIDRELRMMVEILRHSIVRKSSEARIKQEEIKKRLEKKAAKKVEEQEAEAAAKTKTKEEPKTKKKVDIKDLDEKLDKILDTDDLL